MQSVLPARCGARVPADGAPAPLSPAQLIFAMAITGNLASYFAFVATDKNPKWTYDFSQLTFAGTVIYSYVTLLPLIFWLLLRYYEASKKLADVLCIYGYTMAIFVPISILCVLPSNLLRWLVVLYGGGARPRFAPGAARPRPATMLTRGLVCRACAQSSPRSSSSPTSMRTSPTASPTARATPRRRPTRCWV